jgi:hypothetical protein
MNIKVKFHPHALERMLERGATEKEVIETIRYGEQFNAKYGRFGFRRNFQYEGKWHGHHFSTKQIEVFAAKENEWLVITVMVKYF